MDPSVKKVKIEDPLPEKKRKKKIGKFTIRSHSNPLSDKQTIEYPTTPDEMKWGDFYPNLVNNNNNNNNNTELAPSENLGADFADIGSGFGGLLFALSEHFPQKRALGIEIRTLAVEYTRDKILKQREETENKFQNIWVIHGNAMKFTPNYFHKGQLEKMFFLFPDPHFKKSKHKRRIISPELLSEYAFVMKKNGRLYIATDVFDLFEWMSGHLDAHALFERCSDQELVGDVAADLITKVTEEGKKVERGNKDKWKAVYRRV